MSASQGRATEHLVEQRAGSAEGGFTKCRENRGESDEVLLVGKIEDAECPGHEESPSRSGLCALALVDEHRVRAEFGGQADGLRLTKPEVERGMQRLRGTHLQPPGQ